MFLTLNQIFWLDAKSVCFPKKVKAITKSKHSSSFILLVKDLTEKGKLDNSKSGHSKQTIEVDKESMQECVSFCLANGIGDYCEMDFTSPEDGIQFITAQ